MDHDLIERVYEALALTPELKGTQQGAGDFQSVGFTLAAVDGKRGNDGWALCKIAIKESAVDRKSCQGYFEWRKFREKPTKLADLLVEQYLRLKRGEPLAPAWMLPND